jgi:hypothetical protein
MALFSMIIYTEPIPPDQGRIDMDAMLRDGTHPWQQTARITLTRGLAWGIMGGLAGTLIMDTLLMGAMLALGMPALVCFSVVGETVARFLSIPGFEMAGYVPLGVTAHYLIGPLVGAVFGVAYGSVMARVEGLRTGGLKKCIVVAVLYVEFLSQPLLALTPILLRWTTAETLQWFGISFVMHFILGSVLGLVVGSGLRRQLHYTIRRGA